MRRAKVQRILPTVNSWIYSNWFQKFFGSSLGGIPWGLCHLLVNITNTAASGVLGSKGDFLFLLSHEF